MIRYFNAQKKALPSGSQPMSRELDCQDGTNEWNDSANPDNLVWNGLVPRFKTENEAVNSLKASRGDQLAQALVRYLESKYSASQQSGLLGFASYGNASQKQATRDIWDWMLDDVQKGDFLIRRQAIIDAGTHAELDAVSMDFSNNDVTKPAFDYLEVLVMV